MFKKLAWYIMIFYQYSLQYLKTKMAYRADFWIYVLSDILLQSVNLIFIVVVFQHIDYLKGWSREEMFFIYGFFLIPFGFYSGFFNHLFDVPEKYVLEGEMDRILVRPMNSLFQVIVELMNLELIFSSVVGVVIMVFSARAMNLNFNWWDFPLAVLLVISATLIYGGIYIGMASIGFWVEGRMGLMPMIYNLSGYGRYPTTIYKGVIRFILTWILPFAFVGFYPSTLLMHRQEYYSYALLTPLVGTVFFLAGYRLWKIGVKRYVGTGS